MGAASRRRAAPRTSSRGRLFEAVPHARDHFVARMARVAFCALCHIVIFSRKTAIFEISPQDGTRSRGSVSEFIAPFLLPFSHLRALGNSLQPSQNRKKPRKTTLHILRHYPRKHT